MNKKVYHTEKAVDTFKQGFSCSQSVLSAFCEEYNLHKNIALKMTDGFGGGIGRMALVCGAVAGAIMVIGLKHGRIEADDLESKKQMNALIREFVKRFIERNKSITCGELLECDISTDEGYAFAKEHEIFRTTCPKFVSDAAEILDEIL